MNGRKTPTDYRTHLALLFVQITFGGFSVVGKYALTHIEPLAMASMRVLFAGPVLLLIALKHDRALPAVKEIPQLALLGFFGVFINQVLFIIGLNYTSAINAAILMPSIPVFTTAIALLMRIERLTKTRIAGIAAAVIGALIILNIGNLTFSGDAALGNLLILINCASYALFLVLARPVLLRIPPLTVTAWSFLFGGVGVVALGFEDFITTPFMTLPSEVWLSIAYILLLPTLINYVLNVWAVKRSSSSLVAAYTTLQPVVATILAILLLGEYFGIREMAGFALIVLGLVWTSTTPVRK
ncbi:MAG: DMT family transporter [Bacteroidia bacterium]|nr:DMT family transporter [Bacteroidia bacterium]